MTKSRLHSFYILIVLFILTTVAQGQFMTSVTATSITGTGATITWTTCANSDTTVNYGTAAGPPYSFTATTANSVTSHSQALTGLSGGVTYHYQTVSVDANGAVVSSSDKTFSSTATAPAITAQPASVASSCSGDSVSFTAAASGIPTPTDRWQNDGGTGAWVNTSTGSGATTNTYSCTAGNAGCLNGYNYRAVYTNTGGTATTNGAAALTVTALPNSTDPVSSSIAAPATATFSVSATAGSPTYQWQISTDSGTTWNNVSTGTGGTTSSYTTPATTTGMNGYKYRVIATNGCGTHTSAVATLTVTSGALYGLAVADASNRTTGVRALNGATLSGSEYIFTSPAGATTSSPTGINHVDYLLNGTSVSSDSVTPYDYKNAAGAIATGPSCGVSGTGSSKACTLGSSAAAGSTNLVSVMYANGQTVNGVTDTQSNVYTGLAACVGPSFSVRTFYDKNVVGGADTITAAMSASSTFIQINVQNYTGINASQAIDKNACGTGTTAGPVSTLFGKELIFTTAVCTACTPGTGYTARSTLNSNLIEDQTIITNGSYSASIAPAGAAFAIQMSTYPTTTVVAGLDTTTMANGTYTITQNVTKTDTTVETDTATFTVNNTTSAHSVSLSWTAGSATFTPVYYHVNRGVSGGAKSIIATIGNGTSTAATSYVDNTVVTGTTYNYTIDEVDTRGLKSAASNQVNATIP